MYSTMRWTDPHTHSSPKGGRGQEIKHRGCCYTEMERPFLFFQFFQLSFIFSEQILWLDLHVRVRKLVKQVAVDNIALGMNYKISLGTYNIRNTTDRYIERFALLKEIFSELGESCDICGVQEVRFQPSDDIESQVDELLRSPELSVQQTHLRSPFLSHLDPKFRIDGNCILVNSRKFRNLGHADLTLSNCRNAQRVLLELIDSELKVSFTNVHLHHLLDPVIDAGIRLDQVRNTLSWMQELDSSQAVDLSVIVGDFNASPSESSYSCIAMSGYISAYPSRHGAEPIRTFPTGLQASTMDTDPEITCDYIFFKKLSRKVLTVIVSECNLFGNKASHDDDTLYPSDHIGILADINVTIRDDCNLTS
jgi:endonuclease/exonuclease/phosphatase family metal-dependent hydrolase